MNNNLTDITFLLDRSGSMATVRSDVISGFNSFVDDQKKLPGEAVLSLHQFDDHYQTDFTTVNLKHVKPLDESTFQPRGLTALLDALAKTIIATGERLAKMDEKDRPGKVAVIIYSDGLENNSREWAGRKSVIKEMIETQQNVFKWTFAFLGSNFDAISEGGSLGVAPAACLSYASTSSGTRSAYQAMGQAVSSYRSGESNCLSFKPKPEDSKNS